MYLSVARGKPTIGINQHIPPRPNDYGFKEFKLKQWDKYESFLAYPIDFDEDNLLNLINMAAKKEQFKWKKNFIGNEMNSTYLSKLLIKIRNDYSKGVL